ncbi:MAG: hypothetical protein ACPGTO_11965, partial [Polaribacter sp.]
VNVFENVDANTNITADYKDAKLLPKINSKTPLLVNTVKSERIGIDYMHTENEYDDFREEVLLPHRLSQNGPFSAKGD